MTIPYGNGDIMASPCTPDDTALNWQIVSQFQTDVTNQFQTITIGTADHKVALNSADNLAGNGDFLEAKLANSGTYDAGTMRLVQHEDNGDGTERLFVPIDDLGGTGVDTYKFAVDGTDATPNYFINKAHDTGTYNATSDLLVKFEQIGHATFRGSVDVSGLGGILASTAVYTGGCGIIITGASIAFDASAAAGDGLITGSGCSLAVNPGDGIEIVAGAVAVQPNVTIKSIDNITLEVAGSDLTATIDWTEYQVYGIAGDGNGGSDTVTLPVGTVDPGDLAAGCGIAEAALAGGVVEVVIGDFVGPGLKVVTAEGCDQIGVNICEEGGLNIESGTGDSRCLELVQTGKDTGKTQVYGHVNGVYQWLTLTTGCDASP